MAFIKQSAMKTTPYKGISYTYVISNGKDHKRIYYYQAYKKISKGKYALKKFFPNTWGSKELALDAALLWVDNASNYTIRHSF